jgi:hypothetical protein
VPIEVARTRRTAGIWPPSGISSVTACTTRTSGTPTGRTNERDREGSARRVDEAVPYVDEDPFAELAAAGVGAVIEDLPDEARASSTSRARSRSPTATR